MSLLSAFPLVTRPFDALERFFDDGMMSDALGGDILQPFYHRRYWPSPMRSAVDAAQSLSNEFTCTPDKFALNIDVRHFAPEEISVKTVDNSIVVHGKHEEKSDEHGYIQREFTRRYVLPEGVDPKAVTCNVSPNGVLAVQAPRKVAASSVERNVPIAVEHVAGKESAPAVGSSQ